MHHVLSIKHYALSIRHYALIFTLALPLSVAAQVHFAHLSYDKVMQAMPEYITARQQMADLRAQYDGEMKRVEDEFNKKYEEFIVQQNELATPIRMKRQAELQEMMEKNIAFKEEARRLIAEAEQKAYGPIRERLEAAVKTIGQQKGYAFILNTDNAAVPYIDPQQGEDITAAVADFLRTTP